MEKDRKVRASGWQVYYRLRSMRANFITGACGAGVWCIVVFGG